MNLVMRRVRVMQPTTPSPCRRGRSWLQFDVQENGSMNCHWNGNQDVNKEAAVASWENRNWYFDFRHCGVTNEMGSSPQASGFAIVLWLTSLIVGDITMASIFVSIPIIICNGKITSIFIEMIYLLTAFVISNFCRILLPFMIYG